MNEATRGALLIVDDEPLKRVTLRIELSEAGYSVSEAADAASALRMLGVQPIDVVITDLRMPEVDGLQFLEQIKGRWPDVHVILMTAFGSIDSAVEAMKRGAYDYLTKPFRTEVLVEKLERLRAAGTLTNGRANADEIQTLGSMIGRSPAMRRLFDRIRKLGVSHEPILIRGECGVGKAQAAEAVHRVSPRADGPFVTFPCASGEPDRLERELFGAPGNGGGAHAAGGTFVLEHVDALTPEVQAALAGRLRRPVAADAASSGAPAGDVRLISTTRQDLRTLAEQGGFREDLYYHLSAATLDVPPLRERREDIPLLATRFAEAAAGSGRTVRVHPHAIDLLAEHDWPGNLRELEQVVRQAAALCDGDAITPPNVHLPARQAAAAAGLAAGASAAFFPQDGSGLTETIAGVERTLIDAALKRAAGNQARAAQFLGIPRTTLRDKMTKYGMVGDGNYRNAGA